MRKQIIRLTESDLHRIVKNSVNRLLREFDEYSYDDVPDHGGNDIDWVSKEDVTKEATIRATFLIKQRKLILEPSGYAIGDGYDEMDWCSIEITPKIGHSESEGFYVDGLTWDYDEIEEGMEDSVKLRQMINKAIDDKYQEIVDKMYQTCQYFGRD